MIPEGVRGKHGAVKIIKPKDRFIVGPEGGEALLKETVQRLSTTWKEPR